MRISRQHDSPSEQDYRAIEAALSETARGRWFLAEHSRRSRPFDSGMLEDAIARLERSRRGAGPALGRMRARIEEITAYVAAVKADLEHQGSAPPQPPAASFGAPRDQGLVAGILDAAEKLHDLTWSYDSRAFDAARCEAIARQAMKLYGLCLRQGSEAAQARRCAEALDGIATRLAGVLGDLHRELDGPADPHAARDMP